MRLFTATRLTEAWIVPFFSIIIFGATACNRSEPSGEQHPKRTQTADLAACANLMAFGETIYRGALDQGYEPTTWRNRLGSVLTVIPRAGPNLADLVRSPSEEMGNLGERQFTQGATGILTGEGCPIDVQAGEMRLYFPTAWQDIDEEMRTQSAELRYSLLQSVAGLSAHAQSIALKMGSPSKVSE